MALIVITHKARRLIPVINPLRGNGADMNRVLAATAIMTACLFLCFTLSLPSLAQVTSSQCEREVSGEAELQAVVITDIYVSEAKGEVLDICVEVENAKLSISQQGEMRLLQRLLVVEVDYYTTGVRRGKLRRIGAISFDYYTSGSRRGKVRRIGNTELDYYTSGSRVGELRWFGDVEFDYYRSGVRRGRLRRIGDTFFDYDREGRIEISGAFSELDIVIVDFVEAVVD